MDETNKKVFINGFILGTLVSQLSVVIPFCNFIGDTSIGHDGFSIIFSLMLMPVIWLIVILVVWGLNGLLYIFLYLIQTRSTIDIPGSRWFLYGFEIVLLLVIGILIFNYLYSGRGWGGFQMYEFALSVWS